MITWIDTVWVIFLVMLVINDLLTSYFRPVREGLSNSNDNGCDQVTAHKNAGSIAYLQDAVSKLQQTMNSLQTQDDKQQSSIETLEGKVKDMETQLSADTKLSKQNDTAIRGIQTQIQDRIKEHQARMEQVKNQ